MNYQYHIYIWVNYNNSPTWIKASYGNDSPYEPWFQGSGEQWGRYNLPSYIELRENHPCVCRCWPIPTSQGCLKDCNPEFLWLITIFPIELDVDRLGQAVSPFFETPYMYVYIYIYDMIYIYDIYIYIWYIYMIYIWYIYMIYIYMIYIYDIYIWYIYMIYIYDIYIYIWYNIYIVINNII